VHRVSPFSRASLSSRKLCIAEVHLFAKEKGGAKRAQPKAPGKQDVDFAREYAVAPWARPTLSRAQPSRAHRRTSGCAFMKFASTSCFFCSSLVGRPSAFCFWSYLQPR
jgi:hypothetical protein